MIALTVSAPAGAQTASIIGNVSALVDHLPNIPVAGQSDIKVGVTELRIRAVVDAQASPRSWLRLRFAGVAEVSTVERGGSTQPAYADVSEAWGEAGGARGDVRIGMSRVAWGRLDEVQPTDVINPIDVARYLLDGRSEARMAVPMVRARLFGGNRLTVEGVVVPVFRPGTFDRLDERSSPFNLFRELPQPVCPPGLPCFPEWQFERDKPDAGRLQGGGRVSVTSGRVDWSVSGWSGFTPFGLLNGPLQQAVPTFRLEHPRYAMYGADFETVAGKWAIRGEGAYFPDRAVQVENEARWFEGSALEGGAGVDRRAGDFTLSGTVLVRRTTAFVKRQTDSGFQGRRTFRDLYTTERRTNVSFVTGFSRTFNRDRIETRAFSLINPEDRAAFLRGVLTWKPADDVAVETSIGWFAGEGDDVITRFGDRDFGYVRVKYYFGR